MNTPGVVAYTWGASGQGGPPPCASTMIFRIVEGSYPCGGICDVPLPFWAPEAPTDQLRQWTGTLNDMAPAGIYQFSFDPDTQRLTIETLNSVYFRPAPYENAAIWTGFTQTMTGTAQRWTGASPPACVMPLAGVTVEPAEDGDRVDLQAYRHRRSIATVWGNHALQRVTLVGSIQGGFGANGQATAAAFCLNGRLRIYQGDSNTQPYSPSNVGGYVDGFVIAATDPTEDGDLGEFVTLKLLMAVPRG